MPIADDAERPSESMKLDGSHLDEEPLVHDCTPQMRSTCSPLDSAPSLGILYVCLGRPSSHYYCVQEAIKHKAADIVRSRASFLSTAFSSVSTMSSDVYSHILLFRLPEIYNWRITQHMETIPGPPADASLEDKLRVFARGLKQEWKWTTVLSGLLLFTSKGLLRVSGVAEDLVANTFGTISMICAFDGLLIGAFYLTAVSNMHGELLRMQNTARFRLTGWRSVPSLLAAPVAWLAWSAISLLALIISYVWHAGATIETESNGHPSTPSYIAHIAVTGVLLTGIVHFVVIVHSVSKMDSVVEQDVVV